MNACSSGLSTILPLYLLQLGGGIREVALSVFLSNLAVTLGAIFWGKLIDAMQWRRMIIVICSIAMAIVSVSMYFAASIPAIIGISALIGFFSVGPAPVTNLLIMEKSRKEEWIKEFSWTSFISAAGLVVAALVGYVWLMNYKAESYSLVCAAVAACSLAFASIFVKDPLPQGSRYVSIKKIVNAERVILTGRRGLLKIQSFDPAKITLAGLSRKKIIFFAGIGMFFLSGNLFFTPYTPFLKENSISDSGVFLAYTVMNLSRLMFLPFNHRVIRKIGEERMGLFAYVPRAIGITLALASALFFMGSQSSILAITLVAFVAIDVGFNLWSTTTTSSLLKTIPPGKEGSMLGVNSSIIGAGLLAGSVISGEVTERFGYSPTFAMAAGIMVISLLMIRKSQDKPVSRAGGNNNSNPPQISV